MSSQKNRRPKPIRLVEKSVLLPRSVRVLLKMHNFVQNKRMKQFVVVLIENSN
jgi:hypothetical protein